MSTIRDVAKLAGVSTMTVSRVVNNSGYTSQTTRLRVEQAVAQLGYVPNAVARYLRSKQTHTIALVVSDITNPFFTTIARGVEDVAGPRGFAVMFCNTDEDDDEEARYLRLLVERQVDGVLLVPAGNPAASIRMLRAHKVPLVILDRRVPGRPIDTVRCDSEAGAYELVRHLIGLGHRRIGVLTGRRSISTSADRVAGVRRALEESGLTLDEALVRWGRFNFGDLNLADGHQMADEVIAATDDPPTALFAANNFIAFGAIRALREMGLHMPDDISVVAFDDLPTEWVSDPFLTVAAQPAYEIGRRAAEMMIDRLTGERTRTGESVLLPFELIVRRSTAAPRSVGLPLVTPSRPTPARAAAAETGIRRRTPVAKSRQEAVG
jgi:LacI family transcriptional regulator, galactose operon repressor